MNVKRGIFLSVLCWGAMQCMAQKWEWHNPLKNSSKEVSFIQNQGWNEDGGNYHRLPCRAKTQVREAVWSLACQSAGLALRFKTDAKDIRVKYKVTGGYSMPHMPSTGVSGVDLYRWEDKAFCFGEYSFGDTIRYSYHIDRTEKVEKASEYVLYLPLYNEVEYMEVGVPEGGTFSFVPAVMKKTVVVYGTSIAQGACASRPGMAWGNIVSRALDCPLVNLGFSGNGKLEKEVIGLMNEQEACVYIIDCMPNLSDRTAAEIKQLVKRAVMQIREVHDTPVLLVEHAGYSNGEVDRKFFDDYTRVNKGQREAYGELKREGVKELYYLSREELNYHPDSWVDYVHPSDWGMQQQARAVEKKLKEILE